MKIAYIGQKGIPAKIGGVERYVEEVAVRMAKLGHDVYVYVRPYYTPKRLKIYNGVKLISLPSIKTKHLDAITHTFLATMHALFCGYDIIHYHALGPTSLAFIPKIFLRQTAVIATYQTQDYYHSKWGFFAKFYLKFGEWVTLNIPDKTISVTDVLRNYALKNYGRLTLLIPNGTSFMRPVKTLSDFNKWELQKKKYILAVSRLVEHKEIHTLIDAFVALKATRKIDSHMKLVIAGGGSFSDKYVRMLKQMIRGRKDVILAGVQKGEKLAALYTNAYLFVHPSRAEGLSLALLEAMGMGLAPLVSNIAENLCALNGLGFSFETGNVFDLIDKLAFLCNNPTAVKKAAAEVKEMSRAKYDWNIICQKINEVYINESEKKKNILKQTAGGAVALNR